MSSLHCQANAHESMRACQLLDLLRVTESSKRLVLTQLLSGNEKRIIVTLHRLDSETAHDVTANECHLELTSLFCQLRFVRHDEVSVEIHHSLVNEFGQHGSEKLPVRLSHVLGGEAKVVCQDPLQRELAIMPELLDQAAHSASVESRADVTMG